MDKDKLAALAAEIRAAGSPQKKALEALADRDDVTEAELLDALGVSKLGELPTTPYPAEKTPARPTAGKLYDPADKPRKKPGPKPGYKKKAAQQTAPAAAAAAAPAPQADAAGAKPTERAAARLAEADKIRAKLGRGLDCLDAFCAAWNDFSYMQLDGSKQVFVPGAVSDEQMDVINDVVRDASMFLDGWDVLRKLL